VQRRHVEHEVLVGEEVDEAQIAPVQGVTRPLEARRVVEAGEIERRRLVAAARQEDAGLLEGLAYRGDPEPEPPVGAPEQAASTSARRSSASTAPPGNTYAPPTKSACRFRRNMKTCRSGASRTSITVAASRGVTIAAPGI
jgi:hypothetical protein